MKRASSRRGSWILNFVAVALAVAFVWNSITINRGWGYLEISIVPTRSVYGPEWFYIFRIPIIWAQRTPGGLWIHIGKRSGGPWIDYTIQDPRLISDGGPKFTDGG